MCLLSVDTHICRCALDAVSVESADCARWQSPVLSGVRRQSLARMFLQHRHLQPPFNKIIIVNIRANGRRPERGAGGPAARRPGAGARLIDSRPRDTLYLSSHRSPLAGPTKKEIGFADFDPFVFGQRPAMRAGAEKCEGALIGRAGPAPPPRPAALPPPREPPRLSSRAVAASRAALFGFTIYNVQRFSR